MRSRRHIIVPILLLIAALPLVGAGLLVAGLGHLGLGGVLADVSLAENRAFGVQFLLMSLVLIGPGIVLLSLAFVLGRRRPDDAFDASTTSVA
jgi:ABC-type dipeptide/oligopeptide/nickel transport system permease subunit